MSTRTNLNDNVNSVFPFSIGGFDYDLKYPTMEELEPIQNINIERDKLTGRDDEESKAKLKELDEQLENSFYKFIIPVNADQPEIREILKKQPFPVVRAFNKMISDQFSI